MVQLSGKPRHVGGKYWLYKIALIDETLILGADMQKIEIKFDYVSDQEIVYDSKRAGRYTVESMGSKGYFEILEKEGSDIDIILRRNVDKEKPFEFSIKGPFGNLKYLGAGYFHE